MTPDYVLFVLEREILPVLVRSLDYFMVGLLGLLLGMAVHEYFFPCEVCRACTLGVVL